MESPLDEQIAQDMKEELINANEDEKVDEEETGKKLDHGAKRGSKAEIIAKIYKVHEDTQKVCPLPPSRLRRMTKTQLLDYLAECISEAMAQKINEKMGCANMPEDASDTDRQRLMAASFLTMAHNVLANGTEKLVENYTEFSIHGFSDTFEKPQNKQILEETLLQIAEEHDIIQYVDSPWSKLALLWGSGVITNLRKKNINHFKRI